MGADRPHQGPGQRRPRHVTRGNGDARSALRSEIRSQGGVPTLFVDGSPRSGLMFWHSRVEEGAFELSGLARRGVDLVSAGFSSGLRPDGAFDHAATDARMAAILAASPRALILPRVGVVPPEWWLERHEAERMMHLDAGSGEPTPEGGGGVSFASTAWRAEMGEALAGFIAHCEEEYPEHVVGYLVGGGRYGEWSYSWEDVLSDYSEPQRGAFRAWLERRYGGADALRAAWADPAVTFETVEIPRSRTRGRRELSLFDPARETRAIDYLTFHSWIAADALLHFARSAKRALERAGSTKIVGVFYGYHFWDAAIPSNVHNSGHHALGEVLASPDVDFLCAPYSYLERHPGGITISQLPAGSVALHGKLLWSEEDSRTFLAPVSAGYGRSETARQTVGVMRRNLMGILGARGTQWWMDLGGQGWFRDEGLLDAIGELAFFERRVQAAGRDPRPQVAVVASKQSLPFYRQDAALTDALLSRQLSELCHAGFPFDTYLAEDLPEVLSGPDSDAYRLLVFLDAVFLPTEQREAIRSSGARAGRTLLWSHAAGLVTPRGFDTDAMRELTGFRVRLGDTSYGDALSGDPTYPLVVETSITGTRIAYGAAGAIGPILSGDDPEARTLGWLIHPHAPGLLERDFGSWRSVWSAAPGLPAPLLREIASRAGVHVYADSGDQVLACGPYLALHATAGGLRSVRLPRPGRVFDAISEGLVGDRMEHIEVELERGDTAIWRIEPFVAG